MVWYSIISVGDVAEVNVYSQWRAVNLKQQINNTLKMNNWLFHQNGFTRTSLSATVTRISNFVEENVFLFLHRQGSPSGCILSLIAQHLKYGNRNALSMFKALNKCFKFYFIPR